MEKLSGIYFIKNKINNKIYIGSSQDIGTRIKAHISRLKSQKHNNKHLLGAYNKYGINNFTFGIIEECSVENLLIREQFYIDNNKWEMLYNKSKETKNGGKTTSKPLLLLNLDGSISNRFESGADITRFLGYLILDYSVINTSSIKKKKYRIVTPEFYESNKEEILSWRSYSNETEYRKMLKLSVKV